MYNGVGLSTARGSGTNGYVQRNFALVRNQKQKVDYKSEEEIQKAEALLYRPPNQEILAHKRKRQVELKCTEMKEVMEEQGTYSKEEIEKKVIAFRKMLFEKEGISDLAGKATPERATLTGTHEIAEAKEKQNAKLREAFGIKDGYVDGSSFDPERRAKEAEAKAMAEKKYEILRDPSPSPSPPPKKKKKKSGHRSRSESHSPARKEKKKKSHKSKHSRKDKKSSHKSKDKSDKHRSSKRSHRHRSRDNSESESGLESAGSSPERSRRSHHSRSPDSKQSHKKEENGKNGKKSRRSYSSDSDRSRSYSRSPERRSRRRSRSRSRRSHSYSKERRRSRSRSLSYSPYERRKSRSKSPSSKTKEKNFSPIRKRRDSPSFLDRRRITSARKLPVPYDRPAASPAHSDSSLYSHGDHRSYSRSRSRSHDKSHDIRSHDKSPGGTSIR
ncbi:serine/arginine repetitive matrix protein 2 isoform X1 [Strongylocentrotus purpuratus]|uniref:CWF21 domain-containing protein n=1 Tax=Strongylocentrotus purpuratus TaxID=7668 RepID=A0A7M7GH44_STRPU|nr:serine/arginine repetitive matrix protein 2 isoform X1 [Strongylocentrotus purpuratus]|eukprot:XP_003726265.1 PREDICTED: serine/arginine repetitive matrix protein 2 isoform X2 [Strongylocentrotus purpuratus]